MHVDAGTLAEIFVVRALVGILKPAPPADVIDQDRLEASIAVLHIRDHPPQRLAPSDSESAFTFVCVCADDLVPALHGVLTNHVLLVRGRVLLMLGRHPHVLRRGDAVGFLWG